MIKTKQTLLLAFENIFKNVLFLYNFLKLQDMILYFINHKIDKLLHVKINQFPFIGTFFCDYQNSG